MNIKKIGVHIKSKWYLYVIVLLVILIGYIFNKVGQEELAGQEAGVAFSKALTKKSATEQVTTYYKTCLGRSPEKKGLDYHVNLLSSGQSSISQIKEGICNGAEAQKYIASQIKKQNPKIGDSDLKKAVNATIIAVPNNITAGFVLSKAITAGISKVFGVSRPKWYPKEAWKL